MAKDISNYFRWRGHDQYYDPKDMETRHLFYTLKIIWNHSAPEHMKLKPYQKYSFSSYYTTEYMKTAIRVMITELKTRNNIELYLHPLTIMQKHLEAINGKITD